MTLSPRTSAATPIDHRLRQSISDLHRACGVYTMPPVASRILDDVGWRADTDLSDTRLLEPAAGNGEFLVQAGQRLVASCAARGIAPTIRTLRPRIAAFELHGPSAAEARRRVRASLEATGVHHATASACAVAWLRNADFLLSDQPPPSYYTHVVGNPPYLRWSKIPASLRSLYEQRLPRRVTRGDLFLPFLDRSFHLLRPGGTCGFLCSDRWMYMAFADRFRHEWLPWLDILSNTPMAAAAVFDRPVATYPTILVASKRRTRKPTPPPATPGPWRTLDDLKYVIRVGPALGHTPAFVIGPGDDTIEPELLRPWIHSSEIRNGSIDWQGRRVVAMFTDDGELIDLHRFPLLERHLQKFAPQLSRRSIVRRGAPWYRTIDRVRATDWTRPKLVVPEVTRTPRVAVDRSGAVPSHGVYAIFAPDDRIDDLYELLSDKGLARALEGIAPRLNGNYVRCYKRFLSQIRIHSSSP